MNRESAQPQFMTADAAPMLQSVALGALFVIIACITDSAYVLAAGAASAMLVRAHRFRSCGRYLTGSAFIGLGLFTALAGSRSGK